MMSKDLISIVTPVFNESEGISSFYQRLCKALDSLAPNCDFEILFIDNASKDKTVEILKSFMGSDPRIRVICLSKNYGYERSIMTGLLHAKGQAVVEIDSDLQDPPELIVQFIEHWKSGYKVVFGQRSKRDEFFLVSSLRSLHYHLVSWFSDSDLPKNVGEFLLVDRCVLDEIKKQKFVRPYIRGLIFEMGFKSKGLPYKRASRKQGRSHFNFWTMTQFTYNAIIEQSRSPLRSSLYFGFSLLVLFIFYKVACLSLPSFESYLKQINPTKLDFVFVLLCLNLIFIGFVGGYLNRLYDLSRKKPLSIIAEVIESSGSKGT